VGKLRVEHYQEKNYLIYSHKRSDKTGETTWNNQWYKPHGLGYSILKNAGRFTKANAFARIRGSGGNTEAVKEGSTRFLELVNRARIDQITWEFMTEIDRLENEIYILKQQLAPKLKSV
jgi:hypothetical protein